MGGFGAWNGNTGGCGGRDGGTALNEVSSGSLHLYSPGDFRRLLFVRYLVWGEPGSGSKW